MPNENSINRLPVTIYSIISQFNETISKARARIFYTGANRNGTYITEEFANKLLETIPYTPVKGIWDSIEEDFLDHGTERTQGRIYGVVPENANITWETHLDEDGVERNYACVDVLLYTGIYPEAEKIVGKSLSMELYSKTITGQWEFVEGHQHRLFKYETAAFLGLQALGEEVEPCFEGAQFFSLLQSLEKMCATFEKQQLTIGGKKEMPLNFKLSDREKYDVIWNALNTEYTEEGNYTITVNVCEVYDDYALCFDMVENEYFRQEYTKNEEGVELGARKKCYILDVSEEEYSALEAIRAIGENSFVAAHETYTNALNNVAELNSKIEAMTGEHTAAIEGKDATIDELNTQIATLNDSIAEKDGKIAEMNEEIDGLHSYKEGVETAEKQAVIDKYSARLDDDVVATYTAKIGEYTVMDLEKELSYEMVKAMPDIFNKEVAPVVPKVEDEPLSGVEAILQKYKK